MVNMLERRPDSHRRGYARSGMTKESANAIFEQARVLFETKGMTTTDLRLSHATRVLGLPEKLPTAIERADKDRETRLKEAQEIAERKLLEPQTVISSSRRRGSRASGYGLHEDWAPPSRWWKY